VPPWVAAARFMVARCSLATCAGDDGRVGAGCSSARRWRQPGKRRDADGVARGMQRRGRLGLRSIEGTKPRRGRQLSRPSHGGHGRAQRAQAPECEGESERAGGRREGARLSKTRRARRGGAHATSEASHAVLGSYTRSAMTCFSQFKTAMKLTETANFPNLYVPIQLTFDHDARGKVVDLCEVNNIS